MSACLQSKWQLSFCSLSDPPAIQWSVSGAIFNTFSFYIKLAYWYSYLHFALVFTLLTNMFFWWHIACLHFWTRHIAWNSIILFYGCRFILFLIPQSNSWGMHHTANVHCLCMLQGRDEFVCGLLVQKALVGGSLVYPCSFSLDLDGTLCVALCDGWGIRAKTEGFLRSHWVALPCFILQSSPRLLAVVCVVILVSKHFRAIITSWNTLRTISSYAKHQLGFWYFTCFKKQPQGYF